MKNSEVSLGRHLRSCVHRVTLFFFFKLLNRCSWKCLLVVVCCSHVTNEKNTAIFSSKSWFLCGKNMPSNPHIHTSVWQHTAQDVERVDVTWHKLSARISGACDSQITRWAITVSVSMRTSLYLQYCHNSVNILVKVWTGLTMKLYLVSSFALRHHANSHDNGNMLMQGWQGLPREIAPKRKNLLFNKAEGLTHFGREVV